uniref:Predicted protein n=1 Tax=Hordeum vulgare subsp. vulgare TaxID=112509 RepID=F2E7B0_HORVV|nr:predicted protein [Hordeum vulgare subsp. vulgare]
MSFRPVARGPTTGPVRVPPGGPRMVPMVGRYPTAPATSTPPQRSSQYPLRSPPQAEISSGRAQFTSADQRRTSSAARQMPLADGGKERRAINAPQRTVGVGYSSSGRLAMARSSSSAPANRSAGSSQMIARAAVSPQENLRVYREGYRGKIDNLNMEQNFLFYTSRLRMNQTSEAIEEVLRWDELPKDQKYEILERRHDYIQWLFPIREPSAFNSQAQELQAHEAARIAQYERQFPPGRGPICRAYRMMLSFYGIDLMSPEVGSVAASEDCVARCRFLNRSWHNYLRITRIFKSLGELGYEHFKLHLISHFISVVFDPDHPMLNVVDSLEQYWVPSLRDGNELAIALQRLHEAKKTYANLVKKR